MTQVSPEVRKSEPVDLEPDATDLAKWMAYHVLENFHNASRRGDSTSATFYISTNPSVEDMDSTNIHRLAYEQCCSTWGIDPYPEESHVADLGDTFTKEVSAITAISHPYPFCGRLEQSITHFERTEQGYVSQVVLATCNPTLVARA